MKPFFRFLSLALIVFLLLNWLAPKWTKTQYPRQPVPNFSESVRGDYQERIEQKKAQVILMGNSVLIAAIDESLFENITGMKSFKLIVEGGATAQYYLMIKNVIFASKNPPQYLLLFFLDNLLTSPGLWTTGKTFVNRIDETARENETVLIEKVYLNQLDPLELFLNGKIPVFGERQNLKNKIDNHLKYTLPRLIDNCDTTCLDLSIEDVFNFGNLRRFPITPIQLEKDQWTGKNWDFSSLIEKSLLPDIIQLMREKGVQLILVREKNARVMTYEDETDDMQAYFQDLKLYLERENIPLIDLSHDPALTLDMFTDMMHVTPTAEPIYTTLAAKGFLELLERP